MSFIETLSRLLRIRGAAEKTELWDGPNSGAPLRPKKILVFGDSNSYRPRNGRSCWPAMLQRLGGKKLDVVNESSDGRTTGYGTAACNGLKVLEARIHLIASMDFILLALGTNDVKKKYGPPSAAQIVGGIDDLIKAMARNCNGVEPILLTPPPLGSVISGELSGAQERIPLLAAEYRRYAETRKIRLIDVFKTMDREVDLEPDGVHINHHGRRKAAVVVWRHLEQYMKSL